MRHRSIFLYAVIVLAPLSVAAWLGWKVVDHERELARHHAQALLDGQLRDVEQHIARELDAVERELLDRVVDAAAAGAGIDELRRRSRSHPLVAQLFALDDDGALVFPPADATASAAEREFRVRSSALWGHLPWTAPENDRAGDHGWMAWYWEDGVHMLLWRRAADGSVIGVEVDRVALLARISGKLPAAGPDDRRLALVDSRGDVVHQWGQYAAADGEPAAATLGLPAPLDAWRLEYFPSPEVRAALLSGDRRLDLVFGLVAVGIALLGLALYLYRENSRRLRDAARRVTFVTQVSHELKTPLTNIRLYAELTERELDDPAAQHRLGIVVAECERLTGLIDNILAFGRDRRGVLPHRPTWFDVDDAVDAVLSRFAPALDAKRIECSFARGADRPVHADREAVELIVANLVSNVEKYAASGRSLAVATERREGRVAVTVADRGPGIPPAHRERVFEPFYRVSDALTDGVTGTGIGLALARDLARRQGGELDLVTATQGACFRLTLEAPSEREAA